jgi:uncharacterized protein (DUF427 family)
VKATWNGVVLAESDATIVVEGNHYFPPDSVESRYLLASPTKTTCSWKGEASYYTVDVAGARNEDAAWTYPSPKPAAQAIAGYVAFWHGVQVGQEADPRLGSADAAEGAAKRDRS